MPEQYKKNRKVRAIETTANSGKPQEDEIISTSDDSKKMKALIRGSATGNTEEEVTAEETQDSGIVFEIHVGFSTESDNKRQRTSRIPTNLSIARPGSHLYTKCHQRFNSA
ncbi:hypothetical protein AMTR_s00144p00044640 [Amborella trichopoda]|uniref:Uncharacterized protein n=1 Tax=Amborella trichopoda TaxID=13333 RepID=W1P9J1_AMBTC|nr:hypothetical protein AMTR_s00144p00044640 [Amborella trichopoda]